MKVVMVSIAPAPGRRVRFPDGTVLTGRIEVALTPYWMRRIAAGDVIGPAHRHSKPKPGVSRMEKDIIK